LILKAVAEKERHPIEFIKTNRSLLLKEHLWTPIVVSKRIKFELQAKEGWWASG